jgi:hypothetical protein
MMMMMIVHCVISGFYQEIDEKCTLLSLMQRVVVNTSLRKNPEECSSNNCVPIYRKCDKQMVVIIEVYHLD